MERWGFSDRSNADSVSEFRKNRHEVALVCGGIGALVIEPCLQL